MTENTKNENNSFVGNVLHTITLKGFSLLFGMVMYVIFAAVLGPKSLGRYALIQATFGILWTFSVMGIPRAVYYLRTRGAEASPLIVLSALTAVLFSGLFLVVFVLVLPLVTPHIFNSINPQSWYYILWGIPFGCFAISLNFLLLADEQIRFINRTEFIKQGIQLLLCTGLIFVEDPFNYILLITPFPFVIEMAFYLYKLCRMHKLRLVFPGAKFFREALCYGIKNQISVVETLVSWCDKYFIKFFLDDYWVGIYSIAQWFILRLKTLFQLLYNNLFSYLSRKDEKTELEIMVRASRHIWFINLVVFFTFLVLGYPLILILFGADYSGAFWSLVLLDLGLIINSLVMTFSVTYIKRGKPMIPTFAALISSLLNVVLNIVLIPVWNIEGAAAATAFSYLFSWIFITYHFRRYEKKTPLSHLFIPQPGDLRIYKRAIGMVKDFFLKIRERFGKLRLPKK